MRRMPNRPCTRARRRCTRALVSTATINASRSFSKARRGRKDDGGEMKRFRSRESRNLETRRKRGPGYKRANYYGERPLGRERRYFITSGSIVRESVSLSFSAFLSLRLYLRERAAARPSICPSSRPRFVHSSSICGQRCRNFPRFLRRTLRS